MSETEPAKLPAAPEPSITAHTITIDNKSIAFRAEAGWLTLYKNEKPAAEMFHVAYDTEEEDTTGRPITFVFNGGPGAASAYLHVGALGPRRVLFAETGNPTAPPVNLVDNEETWLAFTDLVFVDPIGTGFSRAIEEEKSGGNKEDNSSSGKPSEKAREYWKVTRDLESLCEFITSYLSRHHRWDSPVFLAGESYGGFRGAKLARMLQESYGVGLNGVVLISPALEFSLLDESDYDVLPWIDRMPSMAGAAAHHGRGVSGKSPDEAITQAEAFATGDLVNLLVHGASLPDATRTKILRRLSAFTGVPVDSLARSGGRITNRQFVRELLRDQGLVCGLYDATVTVPDAFPGRDSYEGPDPTLRSIERVFAAGINAHLRRALGVDTERRYHLLSMEVNRNWQVDIERHALESQIGATDDLRYAMTLNPDMKVRITHGVYDLVTPYFASNRIAGVLYLNRVIADNLSLVHYPGGHMFYAWEESRRQFRADIGDFYSGAVSSLR